VLKENPPVVINFIEKKKEAPPSKGKESIFLKLAKALSPPRRGHGKKKEEHVPKSSGEGKGRKIETRVG